MKATLEFNLPDEQSEFETAVNGHKYRRVLWELSQLWFKLRDEELTPEQEALLDRIIGAFIGECGDRGVEI